MSEGHDDIIHHAETAIVQSEMQSAIINLKFLRRPSERDGQISTDIGPLQ